jgi:hypothetical protein
MVNSIKQSADGLALQVTREARKAGLVSEDSDGNATDLSDVHVYGFDDLLVIIDTTVAAGDRAELVATAAQDTGSVHQGSMSTLAVAGNGYQVQLPGCDAAGFAQGDDGHVRAADGVLFIHDGTQGRLIDDMMTIRM